MLPKTQRGTYETSTILIFIDVMIPIHPFVFKNCNTRILQL